MTKTISIDGAVLMALKLFASKDPVREVMMLARLDVDAAGNCLLVSTSGTSLLLVELDNVRRLKPFSTEPCSLPIPLHFPHKATDVVTFSHDASASGFVIEAEVKSASGARVVHFIEATNRAYPNWRSATAILDLAVTSNMTSFAINPSLIANASKAFSLLGQDAPSITLSQSANDYGALFCVNNNIGALAMLMPMRGSDANRTVQPWLKYIAPATQPPKDKERPAPPSPQLQG